MDNPTSQREAVLVQGSKAQSSQPCAPKGEGTQTPTKEPRTELISSPFTMLGSVPTEAAVLPCITVTLALCKARQDLGICLQEVACTHLSECGSSGDDAIERGGGQVTEW